MAPSESEIRTLLSSSSYSPSSIAPLEQYLAAQVSGQAPYLADAVRTLVKLYQLFPAHKNETAIQQCCMLALAEYPSTDLLALSYMVPNIQVQKCADHLNACQFPAFWQAYQEQPDLQAIAPAMKFQQAIAQVLSFTYQQAPRSVVLEALNTTDTALLSSLAAVQKVESDVVYFVPTAENTKRERVYQEGVSFDTVSVLLHKIAQ